MPQCNFSNKISLPKLSGLPLPAAQSTLRTKHSGAGLQRRGAFSETASRERARPVLRGLLPGRRFHAPGSQVPTRLQDSFQNGGAGVSRFISKKPLQQSSSLAFPICLFLVFKNDSTKAPEIICRGFLSHNEQFQN